jgi:septal ring-binding cell division protein DamX
MSTEPILRPSPAGLPDAGACPACAATLAADQRYCLECGERRPATSEFLRSGPPSAQTPPPARPPIASVAAEPAGRPNQMLLLIAGVGVLLLAMGVGVLIGRAGSSSGRPAPAQVITLGSATGTPSVSGTSGAEAFTDDWPAGTKGYTVQLQALPAGTTVAAVGQAKSGAGAKGAGAVGALKEADFSSFSGSGYILYSGVFHKRAEAQKALGSLKSKFPGAKVVEVSNGGSSGSSSSKSGGSSGTGNSLSHPAPPSVLGNPGHAKGKSYEEKSKNLPNVVETG